MAVVVVTEDDCCEGGHTGVRSSDGAGSHGGHCRASRSRHGGDGSGSDGVIIVVAEVGVISDGAVLPITTSTHKAPTTHHVI